MAAPARSRGQEQVVVWVISPVKVQAMVAPASGRAVAQVLLSSPSLPTSIRCVSAADGPMFRPHVLILEMISTFEFLDPSPFPGILRRRHTCVLSARFGSQPNGRELVHSRTHHQTGERHCEG